MAASVLTWPCPRSTGSSPGQPKDLTTALETAGSPTVARCGAAPTTGTRARPDQDQISRISSNGAPSPAAFGGFSLAVLDHRPASDLS